MKSLKKLFTKKRDGNFGDILGTALCIVLLLTIMLALIQYMQLLYVKRDIDNIGREYLLLLEQQGELTPTDVANCKQKLQDMGFLTSPITIDFNNHTNTKVNYAQEVSIYIEIQALATEMRVNSAIPGFRSTYTFHTELYSIAKH